MIGATRVKVCGLTSAADAAAAAAIGADFLGFILYEKSPRFVALAHFATFRPALPALPKVAVLVAPTGEELAAAQAAGFDYFQIHFSGTDVAAAQHASTRVGAARLWLAPKVPRLEDLEAGLLPLADTWLVDAYHAERFGGTGQTGDWAGFRRLGERHPEKNWVLAGGLSPENVKAALAATGAKTIDVNSGVEASPGRKDPAKLEALRGIMTGVVRSEG